MNSITTTLPDRIVFFADAHLGLPGDTTERAERVAEFLRSLRGGISHLYIVGDLFDFWFEYRTVVPSTAPQVLCELYNLVRSGVRVTLLAGNHDYWFGNYLRNGIGVEFAPGEVIADHQGLRIYLHHGDGLYPKDHGYRLLKRFLRNRAIISLFRLIHPDLAHRIAALTSTTSRTILAPRPGRDDEYAALFRLIADRRLAEGYDAVVYGHSHVPLVEKRDGGTLVLLGDWLTHCTYVTLEGGAFTLRHWNTTQENRT
jgi:UDP-2,3-diacylglucosamine hydrolase